MSELSRSVGGPPFVLNVQGKSYGIGLITQDVKAAYEKELFRKAREAVAALRQDLPAEVYKEMMLELAETFEQGKFAMEGERGQKMLGTPRGSLLVLSLLMGTDEAEVARVLMADEPQVMSVFQAVLRESFPGVDFAEGAEPKKAEAA